MSDDSESLNPTTKEIIVSTMSMAVPVSLLAWGARRAPGIIVSIFAPSLVILKYLNTSGLYEIFPLTFFLLTQFAYYGLISLFFGRRQFRSGLMIDIGLVAGIVIGAFLEMILAWRAGGLSIADYDHYLIIPGFVVTGLLVLEYVYWLKRRKRSSTAIVTIVGIFCFAKLLTYSMMLFSAG